MSAHPRRFGYPGQPPPWLTLSKLRTREPIASDAEAEAAWIVFAGDRPAAVALGELILVLVKAGVLTVDDGGNYRVPRR